MCHATMIKAKQAGMSVNDYLQLQKPSYKVRAFRNPSYELRGFYEDVNGKTWLRWYAYMLAPFPCRMTDIMPSTNHRLVSADLTDRLKKED